MRISMSTYCNNKARCLELGTMRFYFSYDTCIAMSYNGERIRLDNTWGPTTGKHINQLGVREFKVVDDTQFAEAVHAAVREYGLQLFNDALLVNP